MHYWVLDVEYQSIIWTQAFMKTCLVNNTSQSWPSLCILLRVGLAKLKFFHFNKVQCIFCYSYLMLLVLCLTFYHQIQAHHFFSYIFLYTFRSIAFTFHYIICSMCLFFHGRCPVCIWIHGFEYGHPSVPSSFDAWLLSPLSSVSFFH